MKSVELFAGAGGLAMGVSRAGFSHAAVIERDRDTCVTLRENKARNIDPVASWPLFEADVTTFEYGSIDGPIDLVAGGPPCQPFSLGGKHRGHMDERNMFPEAARAVRELRPRAFIFENVKGLLRESFTSYFEYIQLELTYPEITRLDGEDWQGHLTRLAQHDKVGRREGLTYRVKHKLLNAANFGVPQLRERVIIVGFREDLDVDWMFQDPTHSLEALLWSQWVTGEYWDRHRVAVADRPQIPAKVRSKVAELRQRLIPPSERPWRTVRDAIHDLPDPETVTDHDFDNHRFQPGARPYPGHTGSIWDVPAKTLKAGDHGVPGGENMLAHYDGRVRYFTVRESARLQTFPDHYHFPVAWTESMRQLGNAVPVELGYSVANRVCERLRQGAEVAR